MEPAALEFIEHTASFDSSEYTQAQLILDTNVAAEIYSIGDVLRELEKIGLRGSLQSPRFNYRRHRAKHSILLAWSLSRSRIPAAFLGAEQINVVVGELAPLDGSLSFRMTKAFVHIIQELVLGSWVLGSLAEVDYYKLQGDADNEILRIAKTDATPVITWEGYREDGSLSLKQGSLRNRCASAGVAVFTPEEWLIQNGVNIEVEALAFIKACDDASWTAQWENVRQGRRDVDLLISFYRLILFGDIEEFARALRLDYMRLSS